MIASQPSRKSPLQHAVTALVVVTIPVVIAALWVRLTREAPPLWALITPCALWIVLGLHYLVTPSPNFRPRTARLLALFFILIGALSALFVLI